jgi:hypothetical protein
MMLGDAVDSPAMRWVRDSVPEFEDAFQDELRQEDGELGVFQAMSRLAEWVEDRLEKDGHDEAAQRAFDIVERLITDRDIQLGDDLAAEFIEATWDNPQARALMGPRTRERATPTQGGT